MTFPSRIVSRFSRFTLTIGLALLVTAICLAQTSTVNPPEGSRSVVKLRARIKVGEKMTDLSRKRFYLIRGSAEQNKELIESFKKHAVVSRDCFYQSVGASAALIKWLQENDCESVYCREVEAKDVEGPVAVPEFQQAVAAGERTWGSAKLARKWFTVNLPEEIRAGFYRQRQQELQEMIRRAEASSGASLISVMTDTRGFAYFTDLEPGAYVISNLLPTEVGANSISWNDCEIQVKPDDVFTQRTYQISNTKDRQTKCVGLEKPLPPCESGK